MDAIYTRQSIDKKDSISIETQIKICSAESSEPKKNIKVYSDKGFSGKNTDRPQFKKLMQDIKAGKINKVIVYRLDRISRALADFARIMEVFEKYGVEFISHTEKFDTSTPIGKAMLSIVMVFAQLERETIQQRIKDNYYSRGEKGLFLGGPPPYGFTKEPTKLDGVKTSILTPEHENIDVVIEIFEKYAYGDFSLGKLVRWLNSNNISAPKGGHWESTKIQRILRNPVYAKCDFDIYCYYQGKGCNISNKSDDFDGTHGAYLYGKRNRSVGKYSDIKDYSLSLAIHEGVINSKTFLKCQYKLDNNKQVKNSGKGQYTWLSGLTKCGKCGYAMTVTKYKEYKYLTCRGRTSYNACEGNQTIHLEDVENLIYKAMLDKIEKIQGTNDKKIKKDHSSKLQEKVFKLENQIENLVEKIANANEVSMEYINKKISQLHKEKQELLNKMLGNAISTDIDFDALRNDLNEWENLSLDKKKIVAKLMIKTVNVSDEGIEIEWKC